MKLAVLDPNYTQYWMEVHRDGCQHVARKTNKREGTYWVVEADTLAEATETIAGDFLDEDPSATVADYVNNHIHWAPCVKLPSGLDEAQPVVEAVKVCKKDASHGPHRITKTGSYCYACDRIVAERQKAERSAKKAAAAK